MYKKSAITSIISVLDVVQALNDKHLKESLYMLDDNKANGSRDLGTNRLRTGVRKGDTLIWAVHMIEAEAFAAISGVDIAPEYCRPEFKLFPDSTVGYWEGEVLQEIPRDHPLSYTIRYHLGFWKMELQTDPYDTPYLIRGI